MTEASRVSLGEFKTLSPILIVVKKSLNDKDNP